MKLEARIAPTTASKPINLILQTGEASVFLYLCLRVTLNGGFDTGYSIVEIGVFS